MKSKKSTQYVVRVPSNLSAGIKACLSEDVTATCVICDALSLYFYAKRMMQND
jgi:hypothetical protein